MLPAVPLFAPPALQHLGEGGWAFPLALCWCCSPCLPQPNSPQVRKYKSTILEDLESALAEHAPAPQEVNSELPPLTIDGIPVSVDKMTQVSRSGLLAGTPCCCVAAAPGDGSDLCPPGLQQLSSGLDVELC